MVGVVERQTREEFVDLIDSIVQQNESRAAQVFLNLTDWDEEPDLRRLEREVADFMGRHLYKPLKDIEIGKLLQELLELATAFRMRLPPDIFLMLKAMSTVEGVGRLLDPEFDMINRCAPFIRQVKMERYTPRRVVEDVSSLATLLMRFLHQFPKELLDLTQLIRKDKLTFHVEPRGIEKILAAHHQTSNRIAFALVIAALIIGSALIVISETPPLFYGISLIGIILFFAAAIMGIWLLVAVIKKGL
jgi:ubiquinone biosynthesis protein